MDGRFYRREQLERIWQLEDRIRANEDTGPRPDFEREHDEAAANVGQLDSLHHREVKPLREGLAVVLRVNHLCGAFEACAELRHSTPIAPSGECIRYSNSTRSQGHETVEAAVAALTALESEVMTNAGAVATG